MVLRVLRKYNTETTSTTARDASIVCTIHNVAYVGNIQTAMGGGTGAHCEKFL